VNVTEVFGRRTHNPLLGGVAIAPSFQPKRFGTLGLVVRDAENPDALLYLTCSHVAYGCKPQAAAAMILQPAVAGKANEIGNDYFNGLNQGIDAATVEPNGTRTALPQRVFCHSKRMTSAWDPDADTLLLKPGDVVRKCGARTNQTSGKMAGFKVPDKPFCIGTLSFLSAVCSIPTPNQPHFADGGDSGAIIYKELADGTCMGVGIIVGTDDPQKIHNSLTYFQPLAVVLEKLGVTL
jgi:hypothetical protein